jgi:hypothetical protein
VWGAPPAGVGCHQNHLAERNSYGVFNKCAHGHQTAGRNRTHRLTWSRVVSMRGRPRFGRWRRGRLTKTDPAQAPHPKPRAGASHQNPLPARAPHQNPARAPHTRIRCPRGRLTKPSPAQASLTKVPVLARAPLARIRCSRGRLLPNFQCSRGRLTPESKPRAGALPKTPRSPLPIAGRSSRRAVEESTPLWSLFVQWPRSRYYQILDVSSTGVAA